MSPKPSYLQSDSKGSQGYITGLCLKQTKIIRRGCVEPDVVANICLLNIQELRQEDFVMSCRLTWATAYLKQKQK